MKELSTLYFIFYANLSMFNVIVAYSALIAVCGTIEQDVSFKSEIIMYLLNSASRIRDAKFPRNTALRARA